MSFQLFDVNTAYEQDKDLKCSDVKILQEWMENQPHLPKACEQQLILFLHCCYYDVEKAKQIMDLFFTLRTLSPELYTMSSIAVLKKAMSVTAVVVLPKKTTKGYAVVVTTVLDRGLENFVHLDQLSFMDKIIMLQLHQLLPVKGVILVMDMKNLSFKLVTRINLGAMKKTSHFGQEALPIRVKGLHYINVSSLVHTVVSMVKPFLKKELYEILNFHTSLENFYKYVPQDILPEDYGGEGPSIAHLHELSCKNVLDNMDFFKWLEEQKVDESKRSVRPKTTGKIFGHGKLKKLEVD